MIEISDVSYWISSSIFVRSKWIYQHNGLKLLGSTEPKGTCIATFCNNLLCIYICLSEHWCYISSQLHILHLLFSVFSVNLLVNCRHLRGAAVVVSSSFDEYFLLQIWILHIYGESEIYITSNSNFLSQSKRVLRKVNVLFMECY